MELKIRFDLLFLLISLVVIATAQIIPSIGVVEANEQPTRLPQKPSRKQFVEHSVPAKVASSGLAGISDDFEDIGRDQTSSSAAADAVFSAESAEAAGPLGEDLLVSSTGGSQEKPNKQRPSIRFEPAAKTPESLDTSATKKPAKKGNFMSSGKFLKDSMKNAYKSTKKYMIEASDSIALIKSKARLQLAIEEANEDIKSVRKEYSLFTVTWSPIMGSALNYVGSHNLSNLRGQDSAHDADELDFNGDALHTLALGYEFMRLLNAWRESLLPVHEAYKHYLQTMQSKLLDPQQQQSGPLVLDDGLFVELKKIHNYLLLTAWLTYDELSKEPREKLEYLVRKMDLNARSGKDFERSYLRQELRLASIYEKTRDKFESERRQVINSLAAAGAQSDSYPDVDEFFDKFRDALDRDQLAGIDHWRVPQRMDKFLRALEPELRLNPSVYDKHFLWRLNKGL